MANLNPSTQLWIMGGIQVLGFVSAWLARLSEGSGHQTKCQRLFLLSLILMGGLTMAAAAGLQPTYWLAPAFTLALMILVVICDFRNCDRSTSRVSGF
jgi:hypothetical protein